ncbi:efflux RND transporter periplasmic adaptor subunit [Luteolibacter ambystomatis]|uniref:Efflux RND transporter periplasmic adaptor subunit n=1 Tax=Luteolibacter ambystomatis TaxID=2824561 RepID=A0A975J270_9BACT|nr:efflux RND transporter periplasmic adaptor subunit [Luteolibacter ambystomatis]QUE52672.1 efflux RND transporter periplasmic adaptor subunit [Luteolibacter ambystomatis]
MNTSETASAPVVSVRSRVRNIALSTAVVAAVAGGYWVTGSHAESSAPAAPPAPPAPTVTVAAVEERPLVDYRELLGHVDAVESVELRPRVSGHIQEVRLKAGEIVEKGDVLFTIDPRWYRAQFDLATAAVDRAKVRVSIAESESKRSTELREVRAVSAEEAEKRQSTLGEAKADLAAAQATLESARLDLEYTEVRAPIRGRVSRALVTAGNLVSGSPGGATLLASIVSVGEVYVYADADESTVLNFNRLRDEGRIHMENGRVPVDIQLTDETGFPHRGYIESTDNRVDPGTGSLVYRMVVPNQDGKLVPGLSARVRLPVSASQPTLLVSERAIGTDQSQKFVLTVAPDKTVGYRSVKLGPLVEGKRVIRDGLRANETVIINGLQHARPGMTVETTSM